MEIICGIYKITSPSGRIYIGESKNINKRWKQYKNLKYCKKQRKLYNSLLRYGTENHTFEIVEECSFNDLLCRERHWQDFYDVIGERGLNLKLTECGDLKQKPSRETLDKLSGENHWTKTKSFSEESIEKMRKAKLGIIRGANSEEHNKKISESLKGVTHSKERIEKNRKSNLGKKQSKESNKKRSITLKLNPPTGKLVLCLCTGIYYNSVSEAARAVSVNIETLRAMLDGKFKNKTNLIYV